VTPDRPPRAVSDAPPAAVLFDRDGTLVVDVPYCADPALVTPVPTARAALALLREAGIPVGVVSNQSGIARGLLRRRQVDAVNRRVDELLGPFAVWQMCPHGPGDGCSCRKPAPGMVLAAAARLGVDPADVAVVGDIGADVDAACAAGARSVLVPTPATLLAEVDAAPVVRPDLLAAVHHLLGTEDRRSHVARESVRSGARVRTDRTGGGDRGQSQDRTVFASSPGLVPPAANVTFGVGGAGSPAGADTADPDAVPAVPEAR
jgi:HAD superfamily hydrolase (TIGR01662 family)